MDGEPVSPYSSIPAMFLARVKKDGDKEAYSFPADPDWRSLTWAQTLERVRAIALGLRALGVSPQQRCAILSGTRIEWILADLGILSAAAATTTIYPSSLADECVFIATDSGSAVVFAEDAGQVQKLVERRSELPGVVKVVTFDGESDGDWVMRLDELEALGREYGAGRPRCFEELIDEIKPDDPATLIYTSGTTGRPKGVRLTHANWLYEAEAINSIGLIGSDDVQYLWLPLSHAFGKVLQVGQYRIGGHTAIDGRVTEIVRNLPRVRPTFMAAAPRIFEKVFNTIVIDTQASGGLKYRIFRWACGVGRQVSALRQAGRSPSGLLKMRYAVADALVFSKLRARFGGRLKLFVSGSAPLAAEIAEFFDGAGLMIAEGYGLTETSAGSCINLPGSYRFGTVGKPLPGTEVSFLEDGEILLRGPGVMAGYHNLPEATAAVLDEEGWLHTGDIGELVDGFLKITDRKKDLIKTAGGKYVAPQALENGLKAICPYISAVIVFGDQRPYCTALITLDPDAIGTWARENGLAGLPYRRLTEHEAVRALIQASVDRLNEGFARHERIKSFAILPRELTVEDGEITPSMKIKRKAVGERYQDRLDALYGETIHSI